MTEPYKYNVSKTVTYPSGAKITVNISSPDPINEADYLILREDALKNMGECMVDLGNAFRPPNSPEMSLTK